MGCRTVLRGSPFSFSLSYCVKSVQRLLLDIAGVGEIIEGGNLVLTDEGFLHGNGRDKGFGRAGRGVELGDLVLADEGLRHGKIRDVGFGDIRGAASHVVEFLLVQFLRSHNLYPP